MVVKDGSRRWRHCEFLGREGGGEIATIKVPNFIFFVPDSSPREEFPHCWRQLLIGSSSRRSLFCWRRLLIVWNLMGAAHFALALVQKLVLCVGSHHH